MKDLIKRGDWEITSKWKLKLTNQRYPETDLGKRERKRNEKGLLFNTQNEKVVRMR